MKARRPQRAGRPEAGRQIEKSGATDRGQTQKSPADRSHHIPVTQLPGRSRKPAFSRTGAPPSPQQNRPPPLHDRRRQIFHATRHGAGRLSMLDQPDHIPNAHGPSLPSESVSLARCARVKLFWKASPGLLQSHMRNDAYARFQAPQTPGRKRAHLTRNL